MSEDEKFECECLECGHKFTSKKHCIDTKCPKCGGKTRRAERPGAGKEKRNTDENHVETADTTNSPPWSSIKKNKENFPNKSQFIIQRGDKQSDWKLPYKVKSGVIHCGGVAAASQAAGGSRQQKPMSLTSTERSRLNGARKACKIGEDKPKTSEEFNLSLSTGKAGKFEFLDDRSDENKRVMRFELMDNAELYNGVRFTKEALQHQLDIFNERNFLVTHGMDHSGKVRDQLGPVIEMEMVEEGDIVTVFTTTEHYMETDAQKEAAILFKQGLLDYISGGWSASIAFNEETKEFEVYKPKFREESSTPIPAKTNAKKLENVCMALQNQISTTVNTEEQEIEDIPMEELDMSDDENQEPMEQPSSVEGAEEQSAEYVALNERQDTLERKVAESEARQEADTKGRLLERAAELGLSEEDFKDVPNEIIEKALEVANKVKMSTLRESDPDIPLGDDGKPQEMTEKEVIETYYDWNLE